MRKSHQKCSEISIKSSNLIQSLIFLWIFPSQRSLYELKALQCHSTIVTSPFLYLPFIFALLMSFCIGSCELQAVNDNLINPDPPEITINATYWIGNEKWLVIYGERKMCWLAACSWDFPLTCWVIYGRMTIAVNWSVIRALKL